MRADDFVRNLLYTPARWWLRRKPVTLPLKAEDVHKILLLRTDAIGDMIVTTPMLTLLKERLGATIDVVASPRNAILLANDPRVRRTMIFDGSLRSLFAVRRATRREHYDLAIALVLHKTTKGGMYANLWAGRKALTVTFAHDSRTSSYQTWFSAQVDVNRNLTTMADMQIQMLNKLFGWNVQADDVPLTLHLPRAVPVQWRGSPRIVLNLSSGNAYRMWSHERNAQCILLLRAKLPDAHVMIMAHGERVYMAQQLATEFEGFADMLPLMSDIRDSIAAMRGADVIITPDTSIVHGAAALDIPVVGIYSHKTSFLNQWMPHRVPYRAVFTDGPVDVDTIEPAQVVDAVMDLLGIVGKNSSTYEE